jgi:hypothetical protein
MDVADLKRLLIRSKKEPVNCAIGLSKDGMPKIHVDKMKQPRACLALLTKDHGSLKMPGFGSVHVDVDEDPKMVILTLNKPAPGFGRKFKKGLKGTGFTKITIVHEDGSPAEQIGEDDDEGDEQTAQTPTPGAASADTSGRAGTGDDAAPDQARVAPAFDAAELTKRLTDAVKAMIPVISANPSVQGDLKTLATNAQAAIKAADPGAEDTIQQLEQAIDNARQNAPVAPADGKQAVLQSAPKLWLDTIATMEADCAKLKDSIRQDFSDQPPQVIADIEKNLDRIDKVCERFDKKLADLLTDAAQAPDQASRNTALTKVRAAVTAQVKWAATDPVIALLDENPWAPMGIKQKFATVLGQVNEASRAVS